MKCARRGYRAGAKGRNAKQEGGEEGNDIEQSEQTRRARGSEENREPFKFLVNCLKCQKTLSAILHILFTGWN